MSINPASAVDLEKKTTTEPAGLLLNKFGIIAAAIILILAAWAGQTVIVILLGLALSAAGLSKLWSTLSLKGVHCERHLSEQRVFPDESLELKIKVVNRKLLPLPWIQINDEVPAGFTPDLKLTPGDKPGFNLISQSTSILWYSAISWKYNLICNKRGYYPLGPLTVTSGDIFGFYPRTATEPIVDHIIVYPRIYSLGQLAIPSLYPLGEAKSEKRIFEDPSRTIGVRDYSPGDSLRRIHWKASARHQGLQVKVFEPTTTLKVASFLAVDSFQYNGQWNEDKLELGISTAASLASYLVDKNSQVGLYTNTRLADSGQPSRIPPVGGVDQLVRILETLAKVVPSSSSPFIDFFQGERKGLPMGTTLIFIFAQLPEKLKGIIADLRENGYKLMLFQIGEMKQEEILPDIAWYNIQQPGELAAIVQGEN
jgi:uncharacterized protein (DUF58 family)